jgi:hypothetical protein
MGGSSDTSSGMFLQPWSQPQPTGAGGTNFPTTQPGVPGPIGFGYQGLPNSFPGQSLQEGYQNIGNLYGGLGAIAPTYYQQAQTNTNQAGTWGQGQLSGIYGQGLGLQQGLTQDAIPQAGSIYGSALGGTQGAYDQAQGQAGGLTGLGIMGAGALSQGAQNQIGSLENQNLGQVNSLLNNYDQSFIQQLGPQGNMGQQLMGEFNNYGLTPNSGAFQSALGNTMGQLGAQNALTLGQEALQPGINAQYGTLGQGLSGQLGELSQGLGTQQGLLGSSAGAQAGLYGQGASGQTGLLSQGLGGQLSTAQQGDQQGGALANYQSLQNMGLGQEGALSPLNYADQAADMQSGIINEASQMPIDYWGSQNNQTFAQDMQAQNQAAQNSAAQQGMYGSLGGAGVSALGTLAAAGKLAAA